MRHTFIDLTQRFSFCCLLSHFIFSLHYGSVFQPFFGMELFVDFRFLTKPRAVTQVFVSIPNGRKHHFPLLRRNAPN